MNDQTNQTGNGKQPTASSQQQNGGAQQQAGQTMGTDPAVHGAGAQNSQNSSTVIGNNAENTGAPGGALLTKLQADLAISEQRIQELTDTSKRALADLSNYRRLVEQERLQYVSFANINFIREILPIADNFARAFSHVPPEVAQSEWYKGVMQIEQQLIGFLKKQGVEEVASSVGKPLDPTVHEPLMTGPGVKDIVIEEFEKGYTLGGQVIRPAKVKVGNGDQQ